jgi:hypothetical protein
MWDPSLRRTVTAMHPYILETFVTDVIAERRETAARRRRFSFRRPGLLTRRAARRTPRRTASPAAT